LKNSHLDISGCNLGAKGSFHLAGVIKDMGALTSLNLSSNEIGAHWDDEQGMMVTPEGTFVVIFAFCSHFVFYVGPVAIADAIKDMGAISSINLLENSIPVEQAQELVKIMQTVGAAIAIVCFAWRPQ
jgi:hypothetical protein